MHQAGAGVLGPVFRGYDPDHDRVVAIKAFLLDLTPEQAQDLAAGLVGLSSTRVEHPFVILPFGAGADGSTPYLVEEYFVADSADVALKQYGPAPLPDALRLIGQLAGALDAAAAAGVHHGALHPRDVLVAPREVRLTGLGVVPALERVGFRPQPRRPYASPERVAGDATTGASDIFSLACIAYEMVTGKRPVPSGDGVAVDTSAIQAADRPALDEVFARVLSARPEDRFPSALDFAASLRHSLTGEPLQADAEAVASRPRRRPRRAREAAPDLLSGLAETAPVDRVPVEQAPVETVSVGAVPVATGHVETVPVEPTRVEPVPPVADVPVDVPVDVRADVPVDEPVDEPADEPVDEPAARVALRPEPTPDEPLDVAPVIVPHPARMPELPRPETPVFPPFIEQPAREPWTARFGRTVVPMLAVLAVGLAAGFGMGYWAASRPAPSAAPGGGAATAARTSDVFLPAPPASEPAVSRAASARDGRAGRAAAGAARPAAVKRGSLAVASTPAGARVLVDGRAVGRTPLTLRDVRPGLHKVRLELPGYRPWAASVRVVGGRQRTVTASLARRPRG